MSQRENTHLTVCCAAKPVGINVDPTAGSTDIPFRFNDWPNSCIGKHFTDFFAPTVASCKGTFTVSSSWDYVSFYFIL